MVNAINHTPEYTTLNMFSSNPKKKNGYLSYRYHKTRQSEFYEDVRSVTGAIIGTAIPLLYFAKKQNVNIFKINYGLKELIGVSSGSIIGGVLGGCINSDIYDKKQKLNEGTFQFLNASIPPALVIGLTKMTKGIKALNNRAGKIGLTAVGLIGGMLAASKLSNFICDPKDKLPDRKLTFKDSLANIDDALGVLAMSEFPALKKIAGVLLPAIYVSCGHRAGDSN